MSIGSAIVRNLSDRLDQRREFLAQQQAAASENLRRIEASRRGTAATARETLRNSTDILMSNGFSEAEVSQLLENDPRELIRLSANIYEGDLRAEDVRAAANFREDYMPETPLSELIREAAPVFRDIEEPEPAARQQNIFRELFNMFTLDTEADMDRFYRESNFGGYSGYDVLGSVEAGTYRERTGAGPLVDLSAIPAQLTSTERNQYANAAVGRITGLSDTIVDTLDTSDPLDLSIRRAFDEAGNSAPAIIDILFDDSNAEQYTRLAPQREQLLEDMARYYQLGPVIFNDPDLMPIRDALEEYIQARNEETTAAPVSPYDTPIQETVLPEPIEIPDGAVDLGEVTEENANDVYRIISSSEADTFVVDGTPYSRDDVSRMLTRFGASAEDIYSRQIDNLNSQLETGNINFSVYNTLRRNQDRVVEILNSSEEAKRLFQRDPAAFVEEYSEQLNGE
jgi:hypothetical protein